ncbi:MAG: cation-transporting P-type ATPase, partial [Candidatus Aenigmarchaeota archaeon]|nr:cation-transporting P-type ATPase [Candidatus Aenigmarchaeota archaeon]
DVEKKKGDAVLMNTFVTVGRAKVVVIETGMNTRIGKIADKLQKMKEDKTSFQIELSQLSKKIFWMIIVLIVLMASIGLFKYGLYVALMISISLAVAAIPEGLPAVVTLSLAFGARKMSKKNALVRKLSVVESAGSIDVICTDKTGTLTEDNMTVRKLFFNGKILDAKEAGNADILLKCGVLCNNSSFASVDGEKKYIGDQTEVALRKIGENFGLIKEGIEIKNKRIDEIPFTSKRKMMTVVYEDGYVYSKGAPEILLKECNKFYQNGEITKLTDDVRNKLLEQNKKFASMGLRVLGFAYKKKDNSKKLEQDLVWIGLQAMSDPPRPEVKKAIEDCKTAGIRIIMITGDNPLTAKSIAKEIGLDSKGVIEGKTLDEIDDDELRKEIESGINIFARVSPEHKLRIMKILKENNRVAMTGDGVNDSLALKKADVGIAMGIRGSDVAKEASDIILLDDNFVSIRNAVEEGRRIFDNIRKFNNYLFSCNIAEVLVLFLATIFLTLKEPILIPVQLLWINLLTDGMPALALGMDPPAPGIMKRKPIKKGEQIINKKLKWLIISIGSEITIILFLLFFLTLPFGIDVARTSLFTGFIIYEFVRIFLIRYQEKLSLFSNKWLMASLFLSLILQLVIIYSPLNVFFKIAPLGIIPWMIILGGMGIGWISGIITTHIIMKKF